MWEDPWVGLLPCISCNPAPCFTLPTVMVMNLWGMRSRPWTSTQKAFGLFRLFLILCYFTSYSITDGEGSSLSAIPPFLPVLSDTYFCSSIPAIQEFLLFLILKILSYLFWVLYRITWLFLLLFVYKQVVFHVYLKMIGYSKKNLPAHKKVTNSVIFICTHADSILVGNNIIHFSFCQTRSMIWLRRRRREWPWADL